MKFSDVFAKSLLACGVTRVYGLQGGSVAHLIDSFERQGGLICFDHHEQHSALAATADYLVTRQVPAVFVSTGPAGTNAITGLLGAFQDSLPVLFVSGQARADEMSYDTGVRQIGSQEAPILDVVAPLTKEATLVRMGESPKNLIESAVRIAVEGRPGPVWLDIPVDVQLAEVKL